MNSHTLYVLNRKNFPHIFSRVLPFRLSSNQNMEANRERRCRRKLSRAATSKCDQEVNSTEWEFISMTEQEEDLICRMFRLVGERWDLVAGRIPGRTAEEIERFWMMRHNEVFAERRRKKTETENSKNSDRRNFYIAG